VGIFNLALQLGGVLILLSNSFGKAWQPMIYSHTTKELAGESIAKTAKYFLTVMLFLTIAIIIFSKEILHILARPAFYEARYVMCLIAVASFFYILTSLSASALLYEKRAGTVQIAIWVTAAINLFLSLIFVPKLQAIGSAYAMLLSFMIYAVIIHLLAQRIVKVVYDWGHIAKIFLTGIAVVTCDWFLSFILFEYYLILAKIILIYSYPLILWLLGVFSKRELIAMYSLFYIHMRKLCPAGQKAIGDN
jgi:O-antigen/teichoic acid export membrane protein